MKFKVEILRIEYRSHTFEVEADTVTEAGDAALEASNDFDFGTCPVHEANELIGSIEMVGRPYDVWTVGTEKNYDAGIERLGALYRKSGRSANYPGGFAVNSPEDGQRLIAERGMQGIWAVYALAAYWDVDTAPSENGWWHALVNESRILHKVVSEHER